MTHSDTCRHAPTPPDPDPANPTRPPGEPCASPQHTGVYLCLEARTTIDLSPDTAQNDINWKVAVASLANILQHHLTTIRCTTDSRYVHAEGAVGDVEKPGHILFTVDLSLLGNPVEIRETAKETMDTPEWAAEVAPPEAAEAAAAEDGKDGTAERAEKVAREARLLTRLDSLRGILSEVLGPLKRQVNPVDHSGIFEALAAANERIGQCQQLVSAIAADINP